MPYPPQNFLMGQARSSQTSRLQSANLLGTCNYFLVIPCLYFIGPEISPSLIHVETRYDARHIASPPLARRKKQRRDEMIDKLPPDKPPPTGPTSVPPAIVRDNAWQAVAPEARGRTVRPLNLSPPGRQRAGQLGLLVAPAQVSASSGDRRVRR